MWQIKILRHKMLYAIFLWLKNSLYFVGFDFDFTHYKQSMFFDQQKISKRCHMENWVFCIMLFLKNEEQNSKQMAFWLQSGLFSYVLIVFTVWQWLDKTKQSKWNSSQCNTWLYTNIKLFINWIACAFSLNVVQSPKNNFAVSVYHCWQSITCSCPLGVNSWFLFRRA